MKNTFLIIFGLMILNSCISRDPFRLCSQKALDSVTYTFVGEWTLGTEVRVYYTNYRGDVNDRVFRRSFSFTERFSRDHIQRRIILEMVQEEEGNVNGILTIYEGAIVIGELEVINGRGRVELDVCS